MGRTSPRVSFGLYALEVKQDSIPSAIDLQPFSKVADLRTDNATTVPIASYEPDFWLLDGGYKFLSDNPASVHVGLMSAAMSRSDGNFTVPPVLTVDFTEPHTSDGLTLRFAQYSGDWASLVKVQYYDASDVLIREDSYAPTNWELVAGQQVEDFQKIIVTFYGTNKPYRYLRLIGIDYGELVYFEGAAIKGASVVEEIDPLSGKAQFNSLDLRLYSSDAAFSIINPEGYYTYLQQRQPLAVHELIDGQMVFIGQYYLDQWENKSETEIEFHCIDLLGIMGTITYRGGLWAGSGIALQDLIEAILGPIYVPYDLDAELYDLMIKGWIPICTYREALQQIALAVGAYLDCSRSGSIKIYKAKIAASSPEYNAVITKAEKGAEQSLALKPQVTGVEVTAHSYVASSTSKQLYNGELSAGQHEISFDEPMHDLSISGATITESGPNYAIVSVDALGTVTLTGWPYQDTTQIFSINTPNLGKSIKPNVLKVTDATLVNPDNVDEVAQRIYDYNQQRYAQKVKLFAPTTFATGDVVLIDTLYGKRLRCTVEKMDIDLFGGMVVQAEMTGVEHVG